VDYSGLDFLILLNLNFLSPCS